MVAEKCVEQVKRAARTCGSLEIGIETTVYCVGAGVPPPVLAPPDVFPPVEPGRVTLMFVGVPELLLVEVPNIPARNM